MKRLTIKRPDDWHLHLRDNETMRAVLPDTAKRFARGIVMPNLAIPIRTVAEARSYRGRILAGLPEGLSFEPLMTLYLTDNTLPSEILAAKESGFIHAVKYYPAGATTNSASGVTDMAKCASVFSAMQEVGLPLLLHSEVTDSSVDIFDREAVFIERFLGKLVETYPRLKIVVEHVTTKQGVEFVKNARQGVAATLTAHHLLLNRNAIFRGGLRPHAYCLPVLKREEHRQALVAAAISGNHKFFLGTDSAPHPSRIKESACGCAGMYTAHAGIELYAEVFEEANALDKLEAFASFYGPDFYNLPRNSSTITLIKEQWPVPSNLPFHTDALVPFRSGEMIAWRVENIV